ncbi:uncharacterized protein LOC143292473 isoform X2 [Babylonia areolata]|uniref:uncharacterized protein LOC143292473 isoform X2 n=1 Tax=Babylonia areolata TaxID=304850 RepID=UPI003FCFD783
MAGLATRVLVFLVVFCLVVNLREAEGSRRSGRSRYRSSRYRSSSTSTSGGGKGWIGGVVIGGIAVTAVIVFLLIKFRHKLPCFSKTTVPTTKVGAAPVTYITDNTKPMDHNSTSFKSDDPYSALPPPWTKGNTLPPLTQATYPPPPPPAYSPPPAYPCSPPPAYDSHGGALP